MRSWPTRWWVPAGALLIAAVVVAVLVIRPGQREIPPLRARAYSDHTTCLLTDARGPAGSEAAPVWAGMQDASVQTTAKVSYLAVIGPATTANARTFVSSLTQRHCELVIAVGKNQTEAASIEAANHPDVTFAVLAATSNTQTLTIAAGPPEQVHTATAKLVRDLVSGNLAHPSAVLMNAPSAAKPAW